MAHQNHARQNSKMKVCAVYCGLFMESRYTCSEKLFLIQALDLGLG
jgi:hypothetical protein